MWWQSRGFRALTAKAIVALTLFGIGAASAAPADPSGDWLVEDRDGVITVARCGDAWCGSITGVASFPAGGLRAHNGEPECQLRIITMRAGDGDRLRGTIRDPRNDSIYDAQMWLAEDGTLRLRGYVAIPLLGSTQTWTRFTGTRTKDCHFKM